MLSPISNYYHAAVGSRPGRYPNNGENLFPVTEYTITSNNSPHEPDLEFIIKGPKKERIKKQAILDSMMEMVAKEPSMDFLKEKESNPAYVTEVITNNDANAQLNDLFNLLARSVQIYMQHAKDKEFKTKTK